MVNSLQVSAAILLGVLQIQAQATSLNVDLEDIQGHAMSTSERVRKALAKYGIEDPTLNSKSNVAVGSTIELTGAYSDIEFIGEIGIGTPPQMFRMDFDTGSTDIWMPSVNCTRTCRSHHRFDPSKSSSFELQENKTWSLRYGDGSSVDGTVARETVHLGSVSSPSQVIGLVFSQSTMFSVDRYLDGIFGLAFPPLSHTGINQSIVEDLYQAGSIPSPVVSFYIGPYQEGGSKGEILFGDINKKRYEGELKHIPVTVEKYWQIDMTGLEVKGEKISNETLAAIVDTGTTLIILPQRLSHEIHQAIPGAEYSGSYGWRIPCDLSEDGSTNSTINIQLDGQDFPLSFKDLVRARSVGVEDEDNLCYSGVAEAETSLIILGDTFLRKYYSVYDFGNMRVSLAKAT